MFRRHIWMLLIGAIAGCGSSDELLYRNRQSFFAEHRDSLTALANDLQSYGRIRLMSDGMRWNIVLNEGGGQLNVAEHGSAQELADERRRLLVETLEHDSIAAEDYEAFRSRLQAQGFVEVEVVPEYTAFLFDAFVDDGNGFLRVEPGGKPPDRELFRMRVVVLEPLEDNWYFFGTS